MTGADVLLKAVPGVRQRPWWLIGWLIAVTVLVARFGGDALRQDFIEPDNAMRLVQVRDLLAGQGWFDLVQHRLGPAPGVEMHWARWIDGALAAQIGLLSPVLGQVNAEIAVSFIWPLGLLAVFLALVSRLCRAFGEREGLGDQMAIAGPVIAALAFPAIEKFGPGAFDHHNVELVFGAVGLLGLLRMASDVRWGLAAGIALAAMMATAAEGVPFAVVGVVAAGGLWLLKPESYARAMIWFGAGMTMTSTIMFALLVPPAEWGKPVCDAMSPVFLTFGLMAGGISAGLGFAPPRATQTLVRRLISGGVMGGIAAIVLLLAFPECAGGGYGAVTPEMKTLWMAQISESRSLLTLWGDDTGLAFALAGAAFSGVIAAAIYLRMRWRQPESWIVPAFLAAACCILVWQVRGATFATAFAIPFGTWAIISARNAWQARRGPAGLLAFAVVAALSTAAVWGTLGAQVRQRMAGGAAGIAAYEKAVGSSEDCFRSAAMAPLKAIPTGRMINEFTLGAAVLLQTSHSVQAAPYHRNGEGVMSMISIMRTTPDAAWTLATWSGADYLLTCPALPEGGFYRKHPAAGVTSDATLAAQLAAGKPPGWLEPVALEGTPLKLYRIARQIPTGASPRQAPLRGPQAP